MELLLALTIMGIVATAGVTLLIGGLNTDRYLRTIMTAQAETDMAMRRIINNIREAQTGTIVVGTGTLTTLTQPDVVDNYPVGVAVSYALQADPANAGQNLLQDTDQRYGASALVHNVKTFSVTAVSGVGGLYQVDLVVVGNSGTEERHVKVYTRN